MKRLGWLSLMLLSGCVLVDARKSDETWIHYSYDSTQSSTTTQAAAAPLPPAKTQVIIRSTPVPVPVGTPVPSPTASNGAQVNATRCKPYVLPTATAQPLSPALDAKLTSEQMDEQVGIYVKALRTYIESERSRIEQSYQSWLDSCQG